MLGAVSNVPYEAPGANELLEGKIPDEALLAKAADLLLEKARVHSHNAHKVPMTRALIRRVLMQLKA